MCEGKKRKMGSARWIAGFLGWVTMGPIGALLGFFAGAMLENAIDVARQLPGGGASRDGYGQRTRTQQDTYARQRPYSATEQRNSFFVSLLVLSSAVIKADGKTAQAEVEVVKDFIRRNFGEAAVADAVQVLGRLNGQRVNIYEVGPQIARYMNYSQRLQLMHYLVQIAKADGLFDKNEKSVIEAIGSTIGLTSSDTASIIAMYYKEVNSAYSVLGIQPSATDDEVRSAYRRMAMKNHPDKVATLGPEVQKAAEEKFRKIQEAYESIKKERGMN